MPRDSRLYMTFPNDIHRHPRISRLDPAVRWAFIEMNGEARIADNDGVFPAEDAEFTWGKEILAELVGSHPTRPLVLHVGDTYVIRDYAEHQETRAAREERRARNAANGAKGGRPPKNRGVTESVSGGFPFGTDSQPTETQTKAESESESEDYSKTSQSQSRNDRARVSTDAIPVSDMTRRLAAQKGITTLRSIVDAVGREVGLSISADQAFQLCTLLLEKAKTWPDNPQAYVLHCIRSSKAEVEQHLYQRVGVAS